VSLPDSRRHTGVTDPSSGLVRPLLVIAANLVGLFVVAYRAKGLRP